MKVAGWDVGGRSAHLCILDPADQRHPFFMAWERPKLHYVEAAQLVGHSLLARRDMWWQNQIGVVWIEEPRGGSVRAVHQLSVMTGSILASTPGSVSVELVPAVECRKLVAVKGNAPKSVIIEWATLETELDFCLDEHLADAYVTARAILAHGSRTEV